MPLRVPAEVVRIAAPLERTTRTEEKAKHWVPRLSLLAKRALEKKFPGIEIDSGTDAEVLTVNGHEVVLHTITPVVNGVIQWNAPREALEERVILFEMEVDVEDEEEEPPGEDTELLATILQTLTDALPSGQPAPPGGRRRKTKARKTKKRKTLRRRRVA